MKKIRMRTLITIIFILIIGSSSRSQQKLNGHVPMAVIKYRLQPISRLDSTKQLHFEISIPLRNQTALDTLLKQLYNPSSSKYHQWLKPEEFTEQFGPTKEDYQSIIEFAQSNGFTIINIHPNRILIDLKGTVSDIEKTFHTTLHMYKHPTEDRTFYAPDSEPTIKIKSKINGILGLDNYGSISNNIKKNTPNLQTQSGNGSESGSYCGYDFRAAYVPNTTLTGTGQSIGFVEFSDYYDNDITTYLNHAKTTNSTLYNSVVTPNRVLTCPRCVCQ